MTDTTLSAADMAAAMQNYQRWENDAAKLVPENKARLFAFLASANITRVIVTFDGEGDSGQIEDVEAFIGNEPVPLPEGVVETLDLPYGEEQPVTRRHTIALVLETLAYDLLQEKHGGWENSDGAYGELVFDVTAGTIALEFNARFMSSERHDYSW